MIANSKPDNKYVTIIIWEIYKPEGSDTWTIDVWKNRQYLDEANKYLAVELLLITLVGSSHTAFHSQVICTSGTTSF
jgi:hypothetical protein